MAQPTTRRAYRSSTTAKHNQPCRVGIAAAFRARREAVGYAVTEFRFFENFLNVARYMADARATA
jgi:hypothetical protein